MVLLNCANIRDGSTVTVVIDENWTVALLKDEIKAKNAATITCDAKDLQLFLAKKDKGRGPWLTEAEEQGGLADTSGLEELDVVGAPLNMAGLSKEDVRFPVTKELVKAKKTPVHVLVVPPVGTTRTEATRQDCSAEWLEGFLSNEVKLHSLPPVASLEEFIKQAPPVKIPMESMVLSAWSMFLDKNDQEKLFTTDTGASCEKIKKKIANMLDPLRSGDTESSFI